MLTLDTALPLPFPLPGRGFHATRSAPEMPRIDAGFGRPTVDAFAAVFTGLSALGHELAIERLSAMRTDGHLRLWVGREEIGELIRAAIDVDVCA